MKEKPLDDPLSWRFWGGIHGFDQTLWQANNYWAVGEPTKAVPYWDQCQHGSWYFLPWHRGYIWAFEAVVRAEVVKLGGDPGWTLPYWDYFKPDQNGLPVEFTSADWPEGQGDNPLYVPQRYGPNGDGNVFIDLSVVNLDSMGDDEFTGADGGTPPGFGGPDTGFHHSRGQHGGLETQPHDNAHVSIGGSFDPSKPEGLMSRPQTAALDPIFWLHHCNIDRLWEVWLRANPNHHNPPESKWLNGPKSTGAEQFILPMPNGESWKFAPKDVVDIGKLGYAYADTTSIEVPARAEARMRALGAPLRGDIQMARSQTELLGANAGAVQFIGQSISTTVAMDSLVRKRVTANLEAVVAGESDTPGKVFLALEHVRAKRDALVFDVYIHANGLEAAGEDAGLKAGSIALFGVTAASQEEDGHAGEGNSYSIDISGIIDSLHLAGSLSDKVRVTLVSRYPIPEDVGLSIERIGIYRQG
ncbi:tyrosinase family protein [Chromobacterium subtsugae]|uniref:Tyrosinase family protein n=3 Tax=Chromobacterium subtsugae TaxID=251747 RepID=A0ABS7FAN1_9NEIS|nr:MULTISPECIES: tyrosinase family protein [Chromobacterium]MBW8287153.1 tyrosinase family protein [Chromobacterium subtsugae]WSE93229.1 tyrosinase family protein [Chromobacterium subtsugae]